MPCINLSTSVGKRCPAFPPRRKSVAPPTFCDLEGKNFDHLKGMLTSQGVTTLSWSTWMVSRLTSPLIVFNLNESCFTDFKSVLNWELNPSIFKLRITAFSFPQQLTDLELMVSEAPWSYVTLTLRGTLVLGSMITICSNSIKVVPTEYKLELLVWTLHAFTETLGFISLCRFLDTTQSQIALCNALPFCKQLFLHANRVLLQLVFLQPGIIQVKHNPIFFIKDLVSGLKPSLVLGHLNDHAKWFPLHKGHFSTLVDGVTKLTFAVKFGLLGWTGTLFSNAEIFKAVVRSSLKKSNKFPHSAIQSCSSEEPNLFTKSLAIKGENFDFILLHVWKFATVSSALAPSISTLIRRIKSQSCTILFELSFAGGNLSISRIIRSACRVILPKRSSKMTKMSSMDLQFLIKARILGQVLKQSLLTALHCAEISWQEFANKSKSSDLKLK